MVMVMTGCGKKSEQAETAKVAAGEERAGTEVVAGNLVAVPVSEGSASTVTGAESPVTVAGAVSAGSALEPAAEFLPVGYSSWKEFEEKYAQFRKERVAAQEELPVNEDGSRVWLGQVVFEDQNVDAQIKTFAMARKLVKGTLGCEFMKMDGTRVKFSEAGLGEAIGKVAAKKYVKVFGWLDEQVGTIKPIYIDVAGERYVWRNGELVKEK